MSAVAAQPSKRDCQSAVEVKTRTRSGWTRSPNTKTMDLALGTCPECTCTVPTSISWLELFLPPGKSQPSLETGANTTFFRKCGQMLQLEWPISWPVSLLQHFLVCPKLLLLWVYSVPPDGLASSPPSLLPTEYSWSPSTQPPQALRGRWTSCYCIPAPSMAGQELGTVPSPVLQALRLEVRKQAQRGELHCSWQHRKHHGFVRPRSTHSSPEGTPDASKDNPGS